MTRRPTRAVLLAAVLGAIPASGNAQTDGSWSVLGDGSWSVPGNWFLGSTPGGGGTAVFGAADAYQTRVIIQDVPNLQISQMSFDGPFRYAVDGVASIELVGAGVIHCNSSDMISGGTLSSGHAIAVPIAGSVGLSKTGPGNLIISGNSTFTGPVSLSGGQVWIALSNADAVFGAASNPLTLSNVALRLTTNWTSSRNITLNGTTIFRQFGSVTSTQNGVISGGGGFNKPLSEGTLILTGANTYGGATTLGGGTLILRGSGSIVNTESILSGGTLILDNAATNVNNRLPDAVGIRFSGSALSLIGSAAAATSESVGASTFSSGLTILSVTANASQGTTLSLASASRENGAAAFFRGSLLGSPPGTSVASIKFSSPPTLVGAGGAPATPDMSIIPWAWGATLVSSGPTTTTNSLVTYDAVRGIRPLNPTTEHVATVVDGSSSTVNLRLTSSLSLTQVTTVNSLTTTSSSGVFGTGTLAVTSGAVLNLATATYSADLEFGASEGVLLCASQLTLNGVVSGSGGLTKAGGAPLNMNGANNYSGVTTISGGSVIVTQNAPENVDGPFGNSADPIVMAPPAGGMAAIYKNVATTLNIDRDIIIRGNGGTCTLGSMTNGDFVLNGDIAFETATTALVFQGGGNALPSQITANGTISGPGFVIDRPDTLITLNGNNSFTGGVYLSSGGLAAGHDNAFGTGTIFVTGNGTLSADNGPKTLANNVRLQGVGALNLWGSPLTFTGEIDLNGVTRPITIFSNVEFAGAVKNGNLLVDGLTYRLILSGNNTYTGLGTVTTGILEIRHANALGTTGNMTTILSGAQLALSNGALSNEPVSAAGSGPDGSGAIRSLGGVNSLGPIAFTGGVIQVDSGELIAGQVSGALASLDKNGEGKLSAAGYRIDTLHVNAGTAAITAGRSPAKTSVVATLSVGAATALDLSDNDLVVNYSGASPVATIFGYLQTGYAGGVWSGTGLTSSPAQTTSGTSTRTALGYAEATDLFTTFPAMFSGQSIDSTAVLVKYTLSGDANLDLSVNGADFNLLATNFGTGSQRWSKGDFSYDGLVNGADFNVLASNFGKTLTGGPGASVPEPSLAGGLTLVSLLLARRRR